MRTRRKWFVPTMYVFLCHQQGMDINLNNYQTAQDHGPIPVPTLTGFTAVSGMCSVCTTQHVHQ